MKMNKIIILTLVYCLFGNVNAAELNNGMVGESNKALQSKKYKQNIKWTGIVVETVVNKDSTCFQVAETVPFDDVPKYTLLEDDSRFIACQAGKVNSKDYNGRLLTVYGNVVSFYNSDNKNGDYSIVEASNLKLWRLKRSTDSYWDRLNDVHTGRAGPESYHNATVAGSVAPSRGL